MQAPAGPQPRGASVTQIHSDHTRWPLAVLINGGAAVALLTFLGNALTRPELAGLKRPLSWALLSFGAGVAMSAVAGGFVYFVQLANSANVEAATKSIEAADLGHEQERQAFLRESERLRARGRRYNIGAILCGLSSLLLFVLGLLLSFLAFRCMP